MPSSPRDLNSGRLFVKQSFLDLRILIRNKFGDLMLELKLACLFEIKVVLRLILLFIPK
jgi:hypothetical protein